MSLYKAVLFDADATLWFTPESPTRVWRQILVDLGFDVPPQHVDLAWEREWKILSPQFAAFESSGHPIKPSAIESMWAASERRLMDDLGLHTDLEKLRRVADGRFAANTELFPETVEVLTELRTMGMKMAMVSNGVNQAQRAERLCIDEYFDSILGSLHVGFAKPDSEIFRLALSALGIRPEEAIMVGDNWEADVVGARGVGIRGIHLTRDIVDSPDSDAITDLRGLVDILNQDE